MIPKNFAITGFLCVVLVVPSAWAQDAQFIWPLSRSSGGSAPLDRLNSPFGPRIRPSDNSYELHPGVDLAGTKEVKVSKDNEVYAAAGGTVVFLTDDAGCKIDEANKTAPHCSDPPFPGSGRIVMLSHGNHLYTIYAHLSRQSEGLKTTPEANTKVSQGEPIGNVGKTGEHAHFTHLHFEVRDGGKKQKFAKNPLGYLSRSINNPPIIKDLSVPSVGATGSVSVTIENSPDGCRLAPDCDIDLNRVVLRIRDGAGKLIEEKAVDFNNRKNVSENNPEDHIKITPIESFNRSDSTYRWTIDFNDVVGISAGNYEVQAIDVSGLCASKNVQIGSGTSLVPFCSLGDYIRDLKENIPDKGTYCFKKPQKTEIAKFGKNLDKLLKLKPGNDIGEIMSDFDKLNYDLKVLSDNSGKSYWVVQERGNHSRKKCETLFRGLGTYIVDSAFNPKRNIVVEVPHPLFDSNTPEEGAKVFQGLEARALFVAGTHRCATPSTHSGCSGKNVCGSSVPADSPPISDAAHSTSNFFFAAHDASLKLSPSPTYLNLHGNEQDGADIILSDGTTSNFPPPNSNVIPLRDALQAQGVSVTSCNAQNNPKKLCGTDNVEGRLSNGSTNPCEKRVKKALGTFLHIEQHQNIRNEPSPLIKALQDVFPE